MDKRILKYMLSGSLYIGMLLTTSCTSGFEDINKPGEKISDEEYGRDNFRLQSYFSQMIDNTISQQENSFQMNENLIGDVYGRYMMTTKPDWNSLDFSTYMAPANWIKAPYNDVMQKFSTPWFEVKKATNQTGAMWAWAQILRVAAMHRLADMYGALPYSKMDGESLLVPYDDTKTIYHAMIDDLTDAVEILKVSDGTLLPDADIIYKGDISKWMKFANSLKLRLAMRLRNAEGEASYAQEKAEEAVKEGVITANEDAPAHSYPQPGVWKMCDNWGNARASADIVSYMVGYEDPRLSKYFKPTTFDGHETEYAGLRAGCKISSMDWACKYSTPVTNQSTDVYYWITAAEVTFLRAEGALYSWNMGGDAESLYKEAIQLSFDQWGAGNASSYCEDGEKTQANYVDPDGSLSASAVSSITIKWEPGNTERNLERIITQKWIAMFPLGQEAWSEHRRTGYPYFFDVAVPTNYSNLPDVAHRIPFNPDEYTNNKENVEAAKAALGGDAYDTKLYWAK